MSNKQIWETWGELWDNIGAIGNKDRVFGLIVDSYTEYYRLYHNLDHIEDCLVKLESVVDQCERSLEVKWAIFFHDIIYNIGSKMNEELSAELATKWLPEEKRNYVNNLILATVHNDKIGGTDAAIIADIDLSTLGAPFEEFDKYDKNIRLEYCGILKEVYVTNRCIFLENLLNKSSIFKRPYFYNRYEDIARNNINKKLKELKME